MWHRQDGNLTSAFLFVAGYKFVLLSSHPSLILIESIGSSFILFSLKPSTQNMRLSVTNTYMNNTNKEIIQNILNAISIITQCWFTGGSNKW